MITVGEAALILNLNLQTIYRKIKRGEIRCVRIGRTVRLRQEDLFTASTELSKARSVPNALLSLFWDADTKSLTSHDEVVIERVLEQGDLGAIRWLLESCDRSRLLKFLNGKGQRRLSKKSLNFWSLYFDQASFRNPRERTEDSLGKLTGVSWLKQFYLAGGTALALHFGHRKSVDFDFFSKNTFQNDSIIEKLEKLGKVRIDNNSNDTLLASVNDVKFSFFLYRHPTLIEPHKYKSLQIASIDDIAVMKLIAISQRGTKKDFVDLWMILEQGYNLTLLFEFMDRKFEGTKYNKANILKSLTFFEDAESDPDPIMLIAESWQLIRRDLTKAALRL